MLHPQRYAIALTTPEFRGAIALKKSIKKSIKKINQKNQSKNRKMGLFAAPFCDLAFMRRRKWSNQADLMPNRIEAPPIDATKSRQKLS
jgi:hypothetical protein